MEVDVNRIESAIKEEIPDISSVSKKPIMNGTRMEIVYDKISPKLTELAEENGATSISIY